MKSLIPLMLLATAACRDEAPPTPTADEANQLNEAEDLLNEAAEPETAAD